MEEEGEEGEEGRRGGGGGGGGQGGHEYELVGVSPGTAPHIEAADKTPPSHQPLPAIPLFVGVAKEGEEEGVYDNVPNDL